MSGAEHHSTLNGASLFEEKHNNTTIKNTITQQLLYDWVFQTGQQWTHSIVRLLPGEQWQRGGGRVRLYDDY